ncbi:unnamed protein product [Schistocephalus solidus]|uniref:Vacuolar protein sorting-associated protein 29 n=1 Tax=Schistocephalus solidus TaxID=70667 RepID=A0A3P7C3L8_SCHSO|nr:unnamed protein product [Schistocephalus solidus]
MNCRQLVGVCTGDFRYWGYEAYDMPIFTYNLGVGEGFYIGVSCQHCEIDSELVLVIGDLHIPERKYYIHPAFKALLAPGKIQHVLCTGNLCSQSVYDQLKCICADVHVVKGEFDELPFPETKILTVGRYKIGLTHGHQVVPWGDRESLAMLRRQLNVSILISGHTHIPEAYEYDGGIFLNPGSATGAFSPLKASPQPTFMLLDIQESSVNLYTYRLVGDEHKVDRMEFPSAA